MTIITDLYDGTSEFEDLLSLATDNAVTQWEQEFCSDLSDKYDQYGDQCFVSERQDEILRRIAGDQP
jgi:hypothetical protein